MKLGKRLSKTLRSEAAKLMGLKVKEVPQVGVCRRLDCTNSLQPGNYRQVWCSDCFIQLRKQQMYFASERYNSRGVRPTRPYHNGCVTKKALLNRSAALAWINNPSNHVGKMADPKFRAALTLQLEQGVKFFRDTKRAVNRALKRARSVK